MKGHIYFQDYHQVTPMGPEIHRKEVEPGKIYSVWYTVSQYQVANYEHKLQKQWGIFETDMQGRMIRNYNLATPDAWQEGHFDIPKSAHIHYADWKDRYFATIAGECVMLSGRYNRLMASFDETKLKLNRLQSHWLIKFVSKFIKL